MLRPHTKNVPYEGWSGAYSVTSVLMQLQSFLYADKIDQDGGYQVNAYKSERSVNRSIKVCRKFTCNKCSHSHYSPWPLLKVPAANIKIYSHKLTSPAYWVGTIGNYGCKYDDKIKVFYEAYTSKDQHGLLRIGYGTEDSLINQCGSNEESFGYEGTGNYWYNNRSIRLFQSDNNGSIRLFRKDSPFTKGDTITVAVDFLDKRIYFAKNGKLLRSGKGLCLPAPLRNKVLYPFVSCRDAGVEFNFGAPKKPCPMLIDQGFHNLEYAFKLGRNHEYGNVGVAVEDIHSGSFTWHNHGVIHELWVWIFECLEVPEIFNAQFTCKKWYGIINRYNIMERNEISCYYTKDKLGQTKGGKVLGIGLTLKPRENGYGGYDFNSQMDILSHDAWFNGCKIGVWGESLTHFLPLVIIAINRYINYYDESNCGSICDE